MEYRSLKKWGLTAKREAESLSYPSLLLARVTEQHRNLYRIICENGFYQASTSGKFVYGARDNSDFPAVGDWVMVEPSGEVAVIHYILERTGLFLRRAAGKTGERQVVASNVDTVFICMALTQDFNLRRLERYLSIAWESGAVPVVVLTKSDLCEDLEMKLAETSGIAIGADILVCSSLAENGYNEVTPYIEPGKTIAFIGSSGVGKTTLINRLIGEEIFVTNEIREDGKGRHSTTSRQLILLPDGGLVLDTPGMRELGAINVDFGKSFADIEELTEKCRFGDCSHTSEPGCAILAAIDDGLLDEARFDNYKKILAETSYSQLSSRQIEEAKIKRMFGGKNEMKQMFREIKKKRR